MGVGTFLIAGVWTADVAEAKSPEILNLYNDKAPWTKSFTSVGEFEARKFGVGFKPVPYSDTTTYQAAIDQSIMGSNPPDLLTWWTGYQFEKLVKTGKLLDLTNEWKSYVKEGLNPGLANAFTVNGKIYGAPLYVSYWVVFYNKHIFNQYGLKPPKTWSQFLNVCDTLKKHGVTPIGQTITGQWPSFIWFEELLVRTDPALYKKLVVGKASYTDPGVVRVMRIWKQLEDKGYFSKPEDMNTGIPADLAKGKIGMFLVGDWYQSSFIQAGLKPGTDYDAFLLPDVAPKAGNVVIFETGPIAIPKNGRHVEDAKVVLRNFYRRETQQMWDNLQGFAPMVRGVTSNPTNTRVNSQITSSHATLIQRYWEATPPDIAQFAVQQLDKFMLHPETYMEDLKAIEQFADRYWKQNK